LQITIDVTLLDPSLQRQFEKWDVNNGRVDKNDIVNALSDFVDVRKSEKTWKYTALFAGGLFVIACFAVFGISVWSNKLASQTVLQNGVLTSKSGQTVSTANSQTYNTNIFSLPSLDSASLLSLTSIHIPNTLGVEYFFNIKGWNRTDTTTLDVLVNDGRKLIITTSSVTLVDTDGSSSVIYTPSAKRDGDSYKTSYSDDGDYRPCPYCWPPPPPYGGGHG